MKKMVSQTVAPFFFLALSCFALVSRSASAQIKLPSVGNIGTVAGDGTGGFSGDGGLATSAELDYDYGVAVDSAGNIYIDEWNNGGRVRKVTASTGDISLVAGNGTWGYSGDGGAATNAELNGPQGVAVDSAGNVYIADTWNNRIRKVTASTGNISTVAGNGTAGFSGDGGAATSAELNSPAGVAVDAAGNIYFADVDNFRIRKVTASTGKISTVAGNGTRGFSGDGGSAIGAEIYAEAVALDSTGNIYIADWGNFRIRVVNTGTAQTTIATIVIPAGDIATVAGNGTGGFSGDGGAAIDAEMWGPTGVAVDTAGNIYIADYHNFRVREVTASSGDIATVAGNGTAGYSGDGATATSAELDFPYSVATDTAANIYITDTYNYRVRAVGGGYSGFVNPKYIVAGVTYAPPGPSSNVNYTGTTSVGNTTTIASSFSNDVGFSVSVKAGIMGWGVGGGVTVTSSTDYTQGSSSSTTTTISKLTSLKYQTTGTGNAFSPIDSDYDTIWLWLNPVVLLSYTPATSKTVAGIQWEGYGFDTTDPSGETQPDVYPVQVGWLNGHFGDSPSIDKILARGWVSPGMTWPSGEGPGLTSADITNIIATDPLTNSGYTELNSFPSTTADGRFTIMGGSNSPNPIPYTQAGPGNGGGLTTIYSTTQTDTQSVATGTSSTFKQAFGVQEVFSAKPFGIGVTTTLKQTDTLTWTNSWLNTLTTTTTLQNALSVTGPNCPAAPPGPCNPIYAGPGQFLLYQDNQYGTFLFFPAN